MGVLCGVFDMDWNWVVLIDGGGSVGGVSGV